MIKESKGEAAISKTLITLGIEFEREKKFEGCRNVKPLPFDFYLPNWNIVIEFDGEHHFRYKGFWNAGRTTLETTQKNDRIKNLFCKKNKMRMIRIPFNMVDKINRIIELEYKRQFNRNLNYSQRLIKRKKQDGTKITAIMSTSIPSICEIQNSVHECLIQIPVNVQPLLH